MSVTPLETELKELIAAEGPMPISRFMGLALGHPAHGYYMGRDPFGARGDFITAPEVSQIFGELIGVWAAAGYQMLGAPQSFHLVELGPGRGTLMSDILRAARVMPGFLEAAQVHMVETSPALRQNQKVKLAKSGAHMHWHERFEDVPGGPLIVVANEFFDALPIHQFQLTPKGWCERVVGLDDTGNLTIGVQHAPVTDIPVWAEKCDEGGICEVAPARAQMADEIGQRIARNEGFGLFIDYGHSKSNVGDTLQALSKHKHVDVLHQPGMCDITSHVDFEALGNAFEGAGCVTHGPVPQGPFLEAMGLHTRAERLSVNANRRQVRAIEAAVKRLASREEMGELFKVLAVAHKDAAVPAPFEGLHA